MATLISLKSKNGKPWQEGLGLDEPDFSGSSLEELSFSPDEGRLNIALAMAAVPEDGACFLALRKALKSASSAAILRVRYPQGALTAQEYLALHFDDLAGLLKAELGGDGDWMGRLEYEAAGEGPVRLLSESAMSCDRLRTRKAPAKFSEFVQWGCGERVEFELRVDVSLRPAEAAPVMAAPAMTTPGPSKLGPYADSKTPVPSPSPSSPSPAPVGAELARPKTAAPQLLFGKGIPDGKIIPLSDLKPGDRGVIEGRVFGETEQRMLGQQKKRRKLKFFVSDGSDSVIVSAWLEPEDKIPKAIGKGAGGDWLRLRGKAEVDKYERDELVFTAEDIMLLPPKLGRMDGAALKRVELHAHTKMSSNDSVVDIEAFVKRAIAWGHEAVAITDHGVVHAFPDAWKASDKGKKIKLILGCEAYLVGSTDFLKAKNGEKIQKDQIPHYNHVVLLAKNDAGRKNLYKLVSRSHLDHYYRKPLVSKALLSELREGLLVGSACENGELMQAAIAGKPYGELKALASLYDYLEVQPTGNNAFLIKNGTFQEEEQLRELVRTVVKLGAELGKPVVAAGDVHYLDPEDEVYRRILQSGIGMNDAEEQAPLYFKTTGEMLADFAFLGAEEAQRLVVEAPRALAALCEVVPPVPQGRFFPEMKGAEDTVRQACEARAKELYGAPLPPAVHERVERELKAVIGNGFASLYLMARLLVQESEKRGYSVGSRGSVGSSVAAYLLGITEVNPLPAHERCPACRHCEFQPMQPLSGLDLAKRPCPKCGAALLRDGHNIPFETFVGFKGDKVPDIDLNFGPEVQGDIQKYVKELFGEGKVFKAGTVSTYSNKTAFGFVKKYLEGKGLSKRSAEVERLKGGLEGVKRTSGQHPGGVVLVKEGSEITDFTPIQYPGDSKELGGSEGSDASDLVITHFDYHSYDENLVKLDILGKDDASAFKHLEELTGLHEKQVPLDDALAVSLFSSRKALGFPKLTDEEEALYGSSGAVALPEFGTENTRRMLEMTKPKNFTELIYISGLSHGTNVWKDNAQDLIRAKVADLATVISTRDDIMNTLIQKGLEPALAFNITEKVRKGAAARDGFKPEEEKAMAAAGVPKWWVESCKKIEYMFPKAHATAYCFTAMRMAYFKAHHPLAFYAAWLTLHAEDLESEAVAKGREAVLTRIRQLRQLRNENAGTAKDESALGTLVVAYEALLRGLSYDKVDLYKSHPTRFLMGSNDKALLPPLVSLAGLGRTAAENIERERALQPFRSVEDLAGRAGLNKTVIEKLNGTGSLDILPKTNQITLF
jgi:DNA polymerase-3 subunit alpha (Gram-positive type)